MKKLLCLLLLMTGLLWAAPSVQVESELSLSETPLPFGKPAELVVTLSWDGSKPFTPPEAKGLTIPDARMIDSYLVSSGGPGKKQAQYHLIFTRFQSGEFTVGPVTIPTESGELTTKPLKMEFGGSQPKEGDKKGEIRGIKPVVELSTADFWKRVLLWVLGTLLALLVVWYIVQRTPALDRFRSPRSRALRGLKRLLKKSSDPEVLLLGVSELVRHYLHRAYALPAPTSTSSELVKGITLDNRCREWKELTSELLQRADGIKFARAGVTASEASDLASKVESQLRSDKGGKRK